MQSEIPVGTGSKTDDPTTRKFLGHPLGLLNLAGVEMWERFSFYGLQAILLYYLYYSVGDDGLGLSEIAAASIVGAYGGMVYLSGVLGAWVADRLLGAERALVLSAVVIMLGHLSLALVPGVLGLGVGLILIAAGSGPLSATTSSILGDMYDLRDERRDAGFSIYYIGVNIGAFVGPLVTGALWGMKGFHWGFGAAAIGMALGLAQYVLLRRSTIGGTGREVLNPLSPRGRARFGAIVAAVVSLVVVLTLLGVITVGRLSGIVTVLTLAVAVALFAVMLTSPSLSRVEHGRVVAFIPMFIASSVFWSMYQQLFTVLALYADKRLDLSVFGLEIPPSWVQSIPPIFVIVFASVFAAMWTKLGSRQPATPVKFALGALVIGAAFLLFLPYANGGPGSTPLLWLVLIMFFFVMAELLISPVGQSLSTKVAPEAFRTQMVAMWFVSIAVGTSAAGWLAGFYDVSNEVPYFLSLGGAAVAVGVILLLLRRWIGSRMDGVR
ncbi:MFS transporter [Arthrobacter echini]|uniref:MFS transporter n=1 Tax=Arthrobacter echini TaxID=1529066 RepID=A0A5D0XU10_9MICC|nr:oligopeptide:H+ symporter [Arthrobacter echini]TYD00176.1 MFS transporter [Arthrobacter echini]